MNGIFSLFLGLLVAPVFCDFPPGSCDKYINIDEPWRNRNFSATSFTGYSKNDTQFLGNWLRFTGIGGDRVVTSCVSVQIGGTHVPIYVAFSLPTNESLTPTNGTAKGCNSLTFPVSVALCPGGFYVYKPLALLPAVNMIYVTYHSECKAGSCGPLATCTSTGGCICEVGYEMPPGYLPISGSYGCVDIDECKRTPKICGSNTDCSNTIGSYSCICVEGFGVNGSALLATVTNGCEDIDECLDGICGKYGTCQNNIGSFACKCDRGFDADYSAPTVCQDVNECLNTTICGPYSICTNLPGNYSCSCQLGFAPTNRTQAPNATNICIDIDECTEPVCSTCVDICGPNCNCSNSIGSYFCTCFPGYRINNPDFIASYDNPCRDIDECTETPGICGALTICTNVPGTFYCSCPDGFFPSTGIIEWKLGVTYCQSLETTLNKIPVKEGQTKERAFLSNMQDDLLNHTDAFLPEATVANSFAASMDVSGVGPRAVTSKVSSEGDGETGSVILGLSEHIVTAMTPATENQTTKQVRTSTVELQLVAIGPGSRDNWNTSLSANGNIMDFNLQAIAQANNGSATAAFMTLNGMESLLSHQYFKSDKQTEMCSDVITAVIPVNNTNLTEPVNFTIYHRKQIPETGTVSCVYWKSSGDGGTDMSWSEEGCWVAFAHENYTICSCSHLSTFALIMQIGEPAPQDHFLEWLNRICVIIGLFFLGLAILTFLLCSWNPKINNTARLHLCLTLAFSQLLLLWNDKYTDQKLACTVMAGLLHFLIVASFVWMLLEALQLHLLVRRLSKVQVIRRDGLPKPLLYLVGYGVPFVIVGVSALIYSDGYGATAANVCWLTTKRNFNWALTGPVVAILGLNWLLFCATLWSLRPTLANMKSDVSQSKDTRLIVFKILAQFVILGCTWILGLYQTNLFFQVLFIMLNSQQGTFLFVVHCLLNKEVRDEYVKWLTCSFGKDASGEQDVPSVTEDFDKHANPSEDGKKED